MNNIYELIKNNEGIPFTLFVHKVNNVEIHLHKEIEILLILQGNINVIVDGTRYLLKENDIILLNSDETHSISSANEDNKCLAFQVDPLILDKIYPNFRKMAFECKSFKHGLKEQERFDTIRYYLARMVWLANKKDDNYQYLIGSILASIGEHLIINFEHQIVGRDRFEDILDKDDRLNRVINQIDENIQEGITLEEIAKVEDISTYYLSHYIKRNLGISFQEYKNLKRLDIAVRLLEETDKTITDISFISGFQSLKLFNNIFKRYYDCSPSQYRKDYSYNGLDEDSLCHKNVGTKSRTYLDVNRNHAFKKLFCYLDLVDESEDSKVKDSIDIEEFNLQVINIDFNKKGTYLKPYWRNLTGFGRAAEGLRSQWREQLRELQSEIGFKHIRFHGIFCDDMMVYNIDNDNNVQYNWNYVDQLFDFFKEVGIKPFVELGFMPSDLKSSDNTYYWWKANMSQPKELNLWTDLVKSFIKHCVNRYGLEEVETWYFEVWNQPDLQYIYWIGNREEYFEFYKETVLAAKSISENIKIGGPACSQQAILEGTWFHDFISYCNDNQLPLDIATIHIFPESYPSLESMDEFMAMIKSGVDLEELKKSILSSSFSLIYNDENHTYDTIQKAKDIMDNILPQSPEIHVTEWNASAFSRNLINDTSYVATYIVKNVLQSIDTVDSLGYWTFTDNLEEDKAGISPFHGGFGLTNNNGIKKPSYFAYYLLSKLGSQIIGQGDSYIVTKTGENLQIMTYNFAYFDELFMNGDASALSYKDRYNVFETKKPLNIKIDISGLTGSYKITKYELNRNHGSAFDEWIRLGAPENMSREEVEYLKRKSYPKMVTEYINIEKEYNLDIRIPVHGIELIVLEKIY